MTVSQELARKNPGPNFTNPFPGITFSELADGVSGLPAGVVLNKLKSTLDNKNAPAAVCVFCSCSNSSTRTRRYFINFPKVLAKFCKENKVTGQTDRQKAEFFLKSFVHVEQGPISLLKASALQKN